MYASIAGAIYTTAESFEILGVLCQAPRPLVWDVYRLGFVPDGKCYGGCLCASVGDS